MVDLESWTTLVSPWKQARLLKSGRKEHHWYCHECDARRPQRGGHTVDDLWYCKECYETVIAPKLHAAQIREWVKKYPQLAK